MPALPNNSQWLTQRINPATPIDMISLPGSHDSGTKKTSGIAQTQSLTIEEQLFVGIRCLDIRLKVIGGRLQVYHGDADCILSFKQVVTWVNSFLQAHPAEFVVMIIKKEDKSSDYTFSSLVDAELKTSGPPLFGPIPKIPLYGQVQGRLVVLKRWADPLGIVTGCNLPKFPENDFGAAQSPDHKLKIVVQDVYNPLLRPPTIMKWTWILSYLEACHHGSKSGDLWFCFTGVGLSPKSSAKGDPELGDGNNDLLVDYFRILPTAAEGYGWVFIDFVEYPQFQCIQCLIDSN